MAARSYGHAVPVALHPLVGSARHASHWTGVMNAATTHLVLSFMFIIAPIGLGHLRQQYRNLA
ncbi:MAG: hypothetical protein M3Z24_06200 [Chloroflexota bacterium]|nr:hypothetical protein [Chloroflexota bacterium]